MKLINNSIPFTIAIALIGLFVLMSIAVQIFHEEEYHEKYRVITQTNPLGEKRYVVQEYAQWFLPYGEGSGYSYYDRTYHQTKTSADSSVTELMRRDYK